MIRGYLLVLTAAIGFGTIALFAMRAYADGADVPTVLVARFGLASLVLWAVCLARRWVARPGSRTLLVVTRAGSAYCLQSVSFFVAVEELGGGLASLLLYLYPGVVAALSAVAARRCPAPSVLASLVLSFVGIGLALGDVSGGGSTLGVLAGVTTAGAYSAYVFLGHHLAGRVPPLLGPAWICTVAVVVAAAGASAVGRLHPELALRSPWGCAGVGLVGGALAISCFFAGVHVVGPTQASLVSTVEPVVTVLGAAWLFGAAMTGWQWFGAALVLAGAVVAVVGQGRPTAHPSGPHVGRVRGDGQA